MHIFLNGVRHKSRTSEYFHYKYEMKASNVILHRAELEHYYWKIKTRFIKFVTTVSHDTNTKKIASSIFFTIFVRIPLSGYGYRNRSPQKHFVFKWLAHPKLHTTTVTCFIVLSLLFYNLDNILKITLESHAQLPIKSISTFIKSNQSNLSRNIPLRCNKRLWLTRSEVQWSLKTIVYCTISPFSVVQFYQ